MSFHVLRFPIGNGTYENIITNLPENEFHAEEIKEIYHLRWGIETSFCTLKHMIAAVNFHAKSRQMISHEIWARLILFIKTCRHFLRLHPWEKAPDVESLIRKHTLPIRPDRNFPVFRLLIRFLSNHAKNLAIIFCEVFLYRLSHEL